MRLDPVMGPPAQAAGIAVPLGAGLPAAAVVLELVGSLCGTIITMNSLHEVGRKAMLSRISPAIPLRLSARQIRGLWRKNGALITAERLPDRDLAEATGKTCTVPAVP